MSIALMRARLAQQLEDISGVRRVYQDEPDIAPASADCPAFVLSMREPFCTAQSAVNSSIDYTWHFDVTFLYTAAGLGSVSETLPALEAYVKKFVDSMAANISGAGTWQDWNKDTATLDFTLGILTRQNASAETRYFGFTTTLDITEFVATTMSAGS